MSDAIISKSLSVLERAKILATWLGENKGHDVVLLNVGEKSSCTDIVIVVTASSARHCRSLADGILEQCHAQKWEYLRVEGYQAGLWILVDLNDIIVDIFQTETRELYRLEDLWRDSPRLKLPEKDPLE